MPRATARTRAASGDRRGPRASTRDAKCAQRRTRALLPRVCRRGRLHRAGLPARAPARRRRGCAGTRGSVGGQPAGPAARRRGAPAAAALVAEFERRVAAEPARPIVQRFRAAGVPASEVRLLDQLFEHDQVRANGLVHTVEHDEVGAVKLLGSVFKIDGLARRPRRSIPGARRAHRGGAERMPPDAGMSEARRRARVRATASARERRRPVPRSAPALAVDPAGAAGASSTSWDGTRSRRTARSPPAPGLARSSSAGGWPRCIMSTACSAPRPMAGDLVRSLGSERRRARAMARRVVRRSCAPSRPRRRTASMCSGSSSSARRSR